MGAGGGEGGRWRRGRRRRSGRAPRPAARGAECRCFTAPRSDTGRRQRGNRWGFFFGLLSPAPAAVCWPQVAGGDRGLESPDAAPQRMNFWCRIATIPVLVHILLLLLLLSFMEFMLVLVVGVLRFPIFFPPCCCSPTCSCC
jgi:hypothetical protein